LQNHWKLPFRAEIGYWSGQEDQEMKFLDKGGAIRMRFIPLFVFPLAVAGVSYGAALSVGAAAGLFFLCFLQFVNFVGLAVLWDRIEKLEHDRGQFDLL
jgi:hypothetical protein